MSTREALSRLVQTERVIHVPPPIRGAAAVRHLFLEASLYQRLMTAMTGSNQTDAALARLYANLGAFTSGQIISIGDHPFDKDRSAFMARTDPPQEGIFDFRIRGKTGIPSTRLFGAFCEADVFLGLTWKLRRELGGQGERHFHNAIMQAIGVWNQLLPECNRFYSENIGDHVSANVHVV